MSDVLTPAQRHYNMSRIKASGTKPEIMLRHALWRRGFRYKINDKSLPGKPDIVLPKYRTVIFVNGCFWHGHDGCHHFVVPKTNTSFWINKIKNNKLRDSIVQSQLEGMGWSVVKVWECQLKNKNFNSTISIIFQALEEYANKHLNHHI